MVDRIQDTERKRGNLNLENHYIAEAIFGRLTADNIPHSITLGNNWDDIRAHNRDPLLNLEIKVKSNVLDSAISKAYEGEDLAASFKATLEIRTKIDGLKPQDFTEPFKKSGLDLEFREFEDPQEGGVKHKFYVSKESASPKVRIRLFNVSYGIYTMRISVPGTDIPLNSKSEFTESQNDFINILEKVVEAVYDMEGKSLPTKKLELKEATKNTNFGVQCSYCDQLYSSAESFVCPGCGASSPVLAEDEKIRYFN